MSEYDLYILASKKFNNYIGMYELASDILWLDTVVITYFTERNS